MLGAHRQAVKMPLAAHILPRDRICEAFGRAKVLDQARHLGHRRDVADENTARNERVRDGLDVFPGGQHVEDYAIDAPLVDRPQYLVHVADTQIPRGMTASEPQVHVRRSDVCEVLAAFDGDQATARSHGVQERHGQGTRPGPSLDDRGTREDIAHVGDDARVLGIDNRRAARHRHDIVNLKGTQDLELTPLVGHDDLTVGAVDNVVVVESTAVGLEASAMHQDHLVEASLRVANLNAVALGQGASAGGLAKIGGRFEIITLNSYYVKNSALGLPAPARTQMGVVGVSVVFMTDLIAPSPGPRTWDPALSASRAKEYERCPLQYRLHVLDGYREPETRAKALGTVVHAVLEELFGLTPHERTPEAARARVAPAYEAVVAKTPAIADLFADEEDLQAWLEDARGVIDGYFAIEQPQWIAPAAREQRVTTTTAGGVRLLGFIDRIDAAPDGRLRVVDYKTGKAPGPRYVDEALYQMRFYALLLARTKTLPARMQLVYLRAGQVITFDPVADDIRAFERHIDDLWTRIASDIANDSFAARKNPLCNWCGVRSLCPVFGGVTPPMPTEHAQWLARTRLG